MSDDTNASQGNADEQAVAQTAAAATITTPTNPNPLVDIKPFKFGFRTQKDEKTGVSTKRPDIELNLAVPSFEGLCKILEAGGKPLDLIYSAIEDVIKAQIKSDLSDDEKLTAETIDLSKYTWDAIANQPESERRGRGIASEIWTEFLASYVSAMPALTGKPAANIETQAKVMLQKFAPLKNHESKESILKSFKDALTVYMNGCPEAEKYTACIEFLNEKADSMLKVDTSADLSKNLGF